MLLADFFTGWEWSGERPGNYGWFHILWLIIMVISCVLACVFLARKHNKKIDDRFIFIIGVTLIVLEIYKQIFYTHTHGHYPWYIFPFQFCSVPMYIAFIAPLIRNERIKEAFYKFLATFGLLAGIAVMVWPDTCLHSAYITIAIHSMIWHASIVVMGIYLVVSRGYGKHFIKEMTPSVIIFAALVSFALIVNLITYNAYFGDPIKNVHNDSLNLFYISPYYGTPFPILCDIKEKVPFPIFFICYIIAFSIGTAALWGLIYLIRLIVYKALNKSNRKQTV